MCKPLSILPAIVTALALFHGGSLADEKSQDQKAQVAIVGDADRFNLGQDGYCGARTEVEDPSGVSFYIPAGKRTWFYIRSRFTGPSIRHTCEGDFSFMPEAGMLHIIRFSYPGECTIEFYRNAPGAKPVQANLLESESRSCLKK